MDEEQVGGLSMKKEMKDLLHFMWDSFGYNQGDMDYYAETNNLTGDEFFELYDNLGRYLDKKYPLEESE